MSLFVRVVFIAIILLLQSLYVPLNRHLTGGVAPKIWLDDLIPLWPVWVFPYISAPMIWYPSIAWSALKMDDRLVRGFLAALLLSVTIGVSCYYLYPTYVIRPELAGNSLSLFVLRIIYHNDKAYNALPSAHIYLTFVICFFWGSWRPGWRWFWAAYFLLVCLSTLFTKQHYILDVVAGAVVGWMSCLLGTRYAGRAAARLRLPDLTGL
jgi:membrane-associated phospholipid phosphatase